MIKGVTWDVTDSCTKGVSSQYGVSSRAFSSSSFPKKNQPQVWQRKTKEVWNTDNVQLQWLSQVSGDHEVKDDVFQEGVNFRRYSTQQWSSTGENHSCILNRGCWLLAIKSSNSHPRQTYHDLWSWNDGIYSCSSHKSEWYQPCFKKNLFYLQCHGEVLDYQ